MSELSALQRQNDLLRQRLRALAEDAADVIMVVGADARIRYQSPAIRRSLGRDPDATLGQSLLSLVEPGDHAQLIDALAQPGRNDAAATRQALLVHLRTEAGVARPFWLRLTPIQDSAGLGGLLLTGSEVSALLTALPERRPQGERQHQLRARLIELTVQSHSDDARAIDDIVRAVAEGLNADGASYWRFPTEPKALECVTLFDRRQQCWDPDWVGVRLATDHLGVGLTQLTERHSFVVSDTSEDVATRRFANDARFSIFQAMLSVAVCVGGQIVGALVAHQTQPRPWRDEEVDFVNSAALLIALAQEAAQRQQAEGKVEQLSWYDPLTGLPNRNLLRESFNDLIAGIGTARRRLALMLVDLDRFKDVNDALGHVVGDSLIKAAAQSLRDVVGSSGTVARLSGDEFVVVVKTFVHRQEVALLAARITQALHQAKFIANVETQISASIGVALFPEHGRDLSALLKNADAAMYQAKSDGRNQFNFFNPIRAERAAREVKLGIELLRAVQGDQRQFYIDYQPIVDLNDHKITGFEALIRWRHPTRGLLMPERFIGVAEASGLSDRITRWLMIEVCEQIVRWRALMPQFATPIAINVAGRELNSTVLPAMVRAMLSKYALDPKLVTLEITERTLVNDGEVNNDVLTDLAALGVGLALDDFGTGYSTLGYLKRLPITTLKIDQSFIKGVPQDADSRALVQAMLAVARQFRFKVVGEGIEREEQARYLRSMGCAYGQGYFFSRPLAADAVLSALVTAPSEEIFEIGETADDPK